MSTFSVIMYHYVRDLQRSRYPGIKGLDSSLFVEQIEYLRKHYTIVTMEAVIDDYENHTQLPPRAALLTFDDGYIDHFQTVFPVLHERKLQGSFFPPVKALTSHIVLDVNKIHFILASVPNVNILVHDLLSQLDLYRPRFSLQPNEYYIETHSVASRFDPAEVIFLKRMLQVELDEELRGIISDYLFRKYVSASEESFSRELYMSMDQLRCMQRCGMHIGSHSYDHYWLGSLDAQKQQEEVRTSLRLLREYGIAMDNWTLSYPYGSYNADTLEVLKNEGCRLALTSKVDMADTAVHAKYEIPRLDTNDIPKDRNQQPNAWYGRA